jgi:carbon dioxide concentrating mechanism protein CcmM
VLFQNRWAPAAVCRTEEGVPIHIGDYSNIQDGVISHPIDAVKDGVNNKNKRFSQNGGRLLGNDTRLDQGQGISSAAM